jgi:hypothetical protein
MRRLLEITGVYLGRWAEWFCTSGKPNYSGGDCFFFAPMSFSQVLNDPSVQKLLPLLAAAIAGQVISLGLSTLAVG